MYARSTTDVGTALAALCLSDEPGDEPVGIAVAPLAQDARVARLLTSDGAVVKVVELELLVGSVEAARLAVVVGARELSVS